MPYQERGNHAKNTNENDPRPYKGYVVAANNDARARGLIPNGYRIDYVERASLGRGIKEGASSHCVRSRSHSKP